MAELLARIDETMELPDAGLWEIRDHPKLHTFSLLMHWYGASVVARAELDEGLTREGRRLADRARELIESRYRRDNYYADAATTDHADAATLMLINLGYLDGKREIAAAHVDAMAERLRVTDCLLKRYAHDDGLGETHSTFTVCGFWYAEALARTGRRDEAERCLQGLLRHANHVGLYSEDVDPATGEQWGNFPQTYSHVGLIQTAFALANDS
jgi:GH15 family glucan-1,4-alpha-glucosidase